MEEVSSYSPAFIFFLAFLSEAAKTKPSVFLSTPRVTRLSATTPKLAPCATFTTFAVMSLETGV